MCKYSTSSLINSIDSVYFPDLVSKYLIPPEPSGYFCHFHLDKTQVQYFVNLDEECDVVLKPLWRVFFGGIKASVPSGMQRYPTKDIASKFFNLEVKRLPLLSLLGCVLLLFYGGCGSQTVPRFADLNMDSEVDGMEGMLLKTSVGIKMQRKLKSLEYVKLMVFDHVFYVKALRSFLASSLRCDRVRYVMITSNVMEVPLLFVIYK